VSGDFSALPARQPSYTFPLRDVINSAKGMKVEIRLTPPRIIESLAPAPVHEAVWKTCVGKGWYYGNFSVSQRGNVPFWKMDLDDDAATKALWDCARGRCEALAGSPLRVVRQYANGHTYGQGGSAHQDDARPGTWTLLYYPMQEWQPDWEGETVWVNGNGDLISVVRPIPNRAVFFDSRIPHYGRAPSRICAALRVTIAFKLETAS
jgi:hypothetical protein